MNSPLVLFNQSSFAAEGCLPLKVVFHRRSSSIKFNEVQHCQVVLKRQISPNKIKKIPKNAKKSQQHNSYRQTLSVSRVDACLYLPMKIG